MLKACAEIAKKTEAAALFAVLDKNIFSWFIRQFNECKELSTKEAGLICLVQVWLFLLNLKFDEYIFVIIKAIF